MSTSTEQAAPSWDEIKLGAQALISLKFNLNLDKAQRMKYDEFESLLYQLFMLIDSPETRRRFPRHKPATDPEGRTRFIEAATRFINDKRLHTPRVTSSQLRMFGGDTFRRLIGSLMEAACKSQTNKLLSDLPAQDQEHFELFRGQSLEAKMDQIRQLSEGLEVSLNELKGLENQLVDVRTKLAECKQQASHKWELVAGKLENQLAGPYDQRQATELYNSLLLRIERSAKVSKEAIDKLAKLKLPAESEGNESRAKQEEEKRLSQFIREARKQLNPNQDSGHRLIGQKLGELDEKMDSCLEQMRLEVELADEMLLKRPEVRERCERLENLISLLPLTSITSPPSSETLDGKSEVPDVETLGKMMADFATPSLGDADIQEVLEVYQAVLNKNERS